MKFLIPKKILFTNNKGGVGKTTLAYNCAYELSKKGYKVCLMDLDPQSNLTRLALGEDFYENNPQNTIYEILQGIVEGGNDINTNIRPQKISEEEFYIVPGNLRLSVFESSLRSSITEARSGNQKGFLETSSIARYMDEIGAKEKFDIFICDTGPSLGLLNNLVFLSCDYFVVPMMPDSFSVQGIENLGLVFKDWKDEWDITKNFAKQKKISSEKVLNGNALFLGYVVNSYNIRNGKPIKDQQKWLAMIPDKVKENLSKKHGRNGLVELSWSTKIGMLKDVGKISPLAQNVSKPIKNITRKEIGEKHFGTMESLKIAKQELEGICSEIEERLKKY